MTNEEKKRIWIEERMAPFKFAVCPRCGKMCIRDRLHRAGQRHPLALAVIRRVDHHIFWHFLSPLFYRSAGKLFSNFAILAVRALI